MNNLNRSETLFFNSGWKFRLADAYPLDTAVKLCADEKSRLFYEPDYNDSDWENVTLPHTFNDSDLFKNKIADYGSGQKRTIAFYRKRFSCPKDAVHGKVFIEFEGIRQACLCYVNGNLAGYYEMGVTPFGFDISRFISYTSENVIAIAADNTATRNIDFCIAETPNKSDAVPGTYLSPQDKAVPDGYNTGVGFLWNCNDFNPSVGGITRNVKIHFKPEAYLTLPLYSNLRTRGAYVYAKNFDIPNGTAEIFTEAEIRNESNSDITAEIRVSVSDLCGNELAAFRSEKKTVAPAGELSSPLSVIPEDAYIPGEINGHAQYVPNNDNPPLTPVESYKTDTLTASSGSIPLRFWNINDPYLYRVCVTLFVNDEEYDNTVIETGFRKIGYDGDRGLLINDTPVWLRGYAQRAANEWAAAGIVPEWMKDFDAMLVRESNANHIRWMHIAAQPADIRSADRHGIVITQPACDKEREIFGREWGQRMEVMRDTIIYFRNSPSIVFWEAGNNSISEEHMRMMRELKAELDPSGGRFMGCRTINLPETVEQSEYVGTMLNRHAARFSAVHGPVTETEYLREESPRRVWDDFSPPDFDYRNKFVGKGGGKRDMRDFYDLTSEDLALASARGYSEYFNDRIGGASGKSLYTAAAALCWTDSAQHGRQAFSENARMSGRVDPVRIKKQSFDVFRVMQSPTPAVKIIGHWNYPADDGKNYYCKEKRFNGDYWEETDKPLKRDPHNKTVYVAASYDISEVRLFINNIPVGTAQKPRDTFIYAFEGIDITQSGEIRADGIGFDGKVVISDTVKTAGKPAKIRLIPHTSPAGFIADGADIAFVDIEVTDKDGNICPLCYDRIDFDINGEAVFLGGYNSGKFDCSYKSDSVIHKSCVFAENGTNRVFLRSTRTAGTISLTAIMSSGITARTEITSIPDLSHDGISPAPIVIYEDYPDIPPQTVEEFVPNPQADALKYVPEDKVYCKVLINGQEPDTESVFSENKNGRIWGNALAILKRIKREFPELLDFDFDGKALRMECSGDVITAEVGRTHLGINGQESLMDGEPYLTPEGKLVAELTAVIPAIHGLVTVYDDSINVLRVYKKGEKPQ